MQIFNFEPKYMKEIDKVPGYFADELEQEHTEEYINKYGYNKVRGEIILIQIL